MASPSCICSFATNMVEYDCRLFLTSISIVQPEIDIVMFVDSHIDNFIRTLNLPLKINTVVLLEPYSHKNRTQMEHEGIFTDFNRIKTTLMDYALERFHDVLYLDCDIFLINPIFFDTKNHSLLLSPHFISKWCTDDVGFYNSGAVWTNDKRFPSVWRENINTSRYFEQAALEDCAKEFDTGEMDENCNVAWWRIEIVDEPKEVAIAYFSADNENIFYKQQPIVFVHTHFNVHNSNYATFNETIRRILKDCPTKENLFKLLY